MNTIRGIVTLLLICLSTLALCIPLYVMGALRLVTRGRLKTWVSGHMDTIIDLWVSFNRLLFRLLRTADIEVRWNGDGGLDREHWYAVVSNHQSWSDILILQNTLRQRIPPLKFFTKRELIWIPLLGVAMWLLGFPYVHRFSREKIAADPALARLDREATLAACARFRDHPTSVLNFLEGTRFTPAKHASQRGRYRHLLNPKLGGLSYVVAGLGNKLHKLIDVTIVYPDGVPTFWDLLCGRCRRVEVRVDSHDLPMSIAGGADAGMVRGQLNPWIETLWRDKDNRLHAAMEPAN
jgi:1-acyl-sn-glycerol-3-phosphate acyltransferase